MRFTGRSKTSWLGWRLLIPLALILSETALAQEPPPNNPCNPCSKKAGNPCNPCSKKAGNPCNPCSGAENASNDELEDAISRALARRYGESEADRKQKLELEREAAERMRANAKKAALNESLRDKPVEFGDDPEPDIASGLVAGRRFLKTDVPNPLMEEECRAQAVERSYAHWVAKTGSEEGFEAHRELWEKKIITGDGIHYGEYLAHIAECEALCRPLIAEIMNCHVLAVSRLDHNILLFGYDSARLERDEMPVVAETARKLQADPELKALLIGRASKLTDTGDVEYNKILAGRRALAVKDVLVDRHQVAADRIFVQAIGWEEPHIGPAIADAYGYGDIYAKVDEAGTNQSVIVVVYKADHE